MNTLIQHAKLAIRMNNNGINTEIYNIMKLYKYVKIN